MASTDLAGLERRARLGYELRRLRLAALGVLPLAIVVGAAAALTQRPASALGFGLASMGIGAAMLWYGRDPQKAVLPGVAAGLVPLALSLCASQVHACGPNGCVSLCVPACMLGGAVAGLAVARVGNRRQAGPRFWLSAAALALLTGAMGCSCIGYGGVLGLAAGLTAGIAPGVVRRARS